MFTGFLTDTQYLFWKIHVFTSKLHHKMRNKNVILFLSAICYHTYRLKQSFDHRAWFTFTSSLKRNCLYFSRTGPFLSIFRAISSPINRLQFIHSIPEKQRIVFYKLLANLKKLWTNQISDPKCYQPKTFCSAGRITPKATKGPLEIQEVNSSLN